MRYVSTLDPTEHLTLTEGFRNGVKPHFRNRCKSILMSNDGYKVPEIARLFDVRTRTIYTWLDRWEELGIGGLMILPGRGSKAILDTISSEEFMLIKEALHVNPQSLKEVCVELSFKLGFEVTKGMLKAFLKKKDIHGNG